LSQSASSLSVAELDPAGHLVSPGAGFTGGGVGVIDATDVTNLAIDAQNNIWVGGSGDGIAELNAAGQGVPTNGWVQGGGPSNTAGVAIDPSGNAWFADGNAAAVFEIGGGTGNTLGTNLSGNTGFAATNCDCNGIAADSAGNMWTIDAGKKIAKVHANGTQDTPIFSNTNLGNGAFFTAIAADTTGSYWITDKQSHSVWQFNSATGTFSANPFMNNAGGGTLPKGIAVDGAQHKWITNQQFQTATLSSVTELSADGTANLSPDLGFGTPSLTGGAHSVAIDQSGNVWVADGGTKVIQFVGAGAPTRNPIVSGITSGLVP
jgi:streptogramin lyase